MADEAALAERLNAFLASRGLTRDTLVTAADAAFDTPLLVVATGSVLQGFGNPLSDVDLSIVVRDEVNRLSLTSRESATVVDTTYFGASEVAEWATALRDTPWPPRPALTREEWDRRDVQLRYATRFCDCVTLRADPGWDSWVAQFRQPWLQTAVVEWWRIEAIRRRVAARWLAETKPLLAAQRYMEAVRAALERRVAAAGQVYHGQKWLPEKLRRLDDADGLQIFRTAARMPTTDHDARAYIARCDDVLDALGVSLETDLAVQLWYLSGVTVHPLDSRTLVSRWNLRGVETRETPPPVPVPAAPVWEDLVAAPLPAIMRTLFLNDMTWLSIVSRPA